MEEKRDLNLQLQEVRKRRDDIENAYRSIKLRIEEMDEEITANSIKLSNKVNDCTTMKPDAQLLEIYAEREQLDSEMRKKQLDFDEQFDREYKQQLYDIDQEEKELLIQIEKLEETDKEETDKEESEE